MDELIKLNSKKVDELNSMRISRAYKKGKFKYKHIFKLLPLFYHINHPKFIFYVPCCPSKVYDFILNDDQKNFLEDFDLRFRKEIQSDLEQDIYIKYKDYIKVYKKPINCSKNNRQFNLLHYLSEDAPLDEKNISNITNLINPDILGIYCMGSTSTLTQTLDSDIDLWIVTRVDLSIEKIELLKIKNKLITDWAKKMDVDLSIFIVNEDSFVDIESNFNLEHVDSCSDLQTILLLDEFYRSFIRIAGKGILWSVLPKEDCSYKETKNKFIESGCINPIEWIDFGGLDNLSLFEFYGSTLWNLYKSTASPFKSLSKSLLIEYYLDTYPKIEFLSEEIKDILHNHSNDEERSWFDFDPYLLLLEKACTYLKNKNDDRYDLAILCFYLKIYNKIRNQDSNVDSDIYFNWFNQKLEQVKKKFPVSDVIYQDAIRYEDWCINLVVLYSNRIKKSMIKTYNKVIKFSQDHEFSINWDPIHLMNLSKTLYRTFYSSPHKISNYSLHHSLKKTLVSHATITKIDENNSKCIKPGWYLSTINSNSTVEDYKYTHVEVKDRLIRLVAWGFFNNVINESTELELHVRDNFRFNVNDIKWILHNMALLFKKEEISKNNMKALYYQSISHMLIIVSESLNKKDVDVIINNNNIIRHSHKVIDTINIVYVTHWGEIITQRFNGSNSLPNLLKYTYKHIDISIKDPVIKVIDIGNSVGDDILNSIQYALLENIKSKRTNMLPNTYSFKKNSSLGNIIVNEFHGIEFDDDVFIPKVIDNNIQINSLQVFYHHHENGFTLFLSHEDNSFEGYYNCQGSSLELSKRIYDHYTKQFLAQHKNSFGFCTPLVLFYKFSHDINLDYTCEQYERTL